MEKTDEIYRLIELQLQAIEIDGIHVKIYIENIRQLLESLKNEQRPVECG